MDKYLPKFYKFIGNSNTSFTNNKIYEIIVPEKLNTPGNFIDNVGDKNGHYPSNETYFEPCLIQDKIKKENMNYLILILKKLNIT
jgi:hypothetical protein